MNKTIYILTFLVLFVSACTEPIDLDLNTDENVRVVVDAHLTTETKAHLVNLTNTRDYFTQGDPIPATGALVTLSDGSNTETLVEAEPGHYFTTDNYAGEVGKTYTLTVEYNGKTHKAVSEILPVASLDDVYYEIDEDNDDESTIEGENGEIIFETFYDIYGVAEEPDTPGNHYMWFVNVNGERYQKNYMDWFFVNDDGVNGQHIDVDFFSVVAYPDDVVELEQLSITEDAHDFLFDIALEVFRGGLFDGAPANVRTNFDNGALGYFITSDISTKSVVIEE